MADFSYDLDLLREARKSVNELRDNLNDDVETLDTQLQTLKSEWKTEAGDKFFEDHKDTWSKYVKKYVKKLDGLTKMLDQAIKEYKEIDNEVSKLKV